MLFPNPGLVSNRTLSLQAQALSILRTFGADAHVYLPGATTTSYGPELVTNGDFSAGTTGWSVMAPWAVSGGALTINGTGVGGENSSQARPGTIVAGKSYRITFDVVQTSGSYAFYSLGNTLWTGGSHNGPQSVVVTAQSTGTTFSISANAAFTGSFDNISIREVITSSAVVSGLTAGNYLDSTGTSLAAVDGLDGLVLDAAGTSSAVVNVGSTTVGVVGAGVLAIGASIPVVQGRAYQITYTITALVGQASGGIISQANGFAQSVNWTGSYSETLFASASSTIGVGIVGRGAGITSCTGSVTVTEVTGTHATSTGAARPTLRRGEVALSRDSWDLSSDGVWARTGTATKTGANQLNFPAVADKVLQSVTRTVNIGDALTFAIELSGTGSTTIELYRNDGATGEGTFLTVDLTPTPTVYTVSKTFAFAHTAVRIGIFRDVAQTATSVTVAKAALFQGTLTAAQILAEGGIPVTTTTAASNPNAGRYSLAFSGAQSMALGSVPWASTDDHAVIFAATPTLLAGTKAVFTVGGATSNPNFPLLGFNSSGNAIVYWQDDASTLAIIADAVNHVNAPTVIACRKVGVNKQLWVNGVQIGATNTTVMGTTTLTNATIGALSTLGNYMTGSIGEGVILKGTLTDAELLTEMRYAAANFPNAPTF